MDGDGEEKQEGGREAGGGGRTAERMERKRDPDADASETREGRGEREKISIYGKKSEGSVIQKAPRLRELESQVWSGIRPRFPVCGSPADICAFST